MQERLEKRIVAPERTIVLIAVPDAVRRDVLRSLFSGNDYHIFEASDANDTSLLFSQLQPDIVVLDSLLGRSEAAAVCETIRRMTGYDSAAVVVTGPDNEIDRIRFVN